MSLQKKVNELFTQQISGWPLLGENWHRMDATLLKTFDFNGFTIKVQFNPERIRSSSALVDKGSIEKRPCFLCQGNRPAEEDHVSIAEDYEVLCNPFPIFRRHFTIARKEHTPQVIDPEFSRMLDLSMELPELVLFYNGPACGASAPDHMHFQAGNLGFMPIEGELPGLIQRYGRRLSQDNSLSVLALNDGLRRFFVLESVHREPLIGALLHISAFMRGLLRGEEPMLNILVYYKKGWQVLVFPREKHRPWQFFREGEDNILLSPASVDMGGMMITPMEKDFIKIGRDDIVDIFNQVGLSNGRYNQLISFLSAQYK